MNIFHKLANTHPKIHCLIYVTIIGFLGIFFFFGFVFEEIKRQRIIQEQFHYIYDDLVDYWKKTFKKN